MDEYAFRATKLAAVIFLAAGMSGCITGPTQGQPSLAGFLGLPTLNQSRDNSVNANGNKPQKERMDPLKRIADPANAQSDNAAIAKAAKVKQQQDLRCQKLKAIKYLATIGCSCYDKDGEITKALQASLTDCDEEVRLATVQAVMTTASDGPCEQCGSSSCCKKPIVEQLSKMAWEVDDKGCWIEPSERVRKLAARAAEMCCPFQETQMQQTTPIPKVDTNPEPAPLEGNGEQPQASDGGDSMDDEVSLKRLHRGVVHRAGAYRDCAIAVVNAEIEDDIPELSTQPEVVTVAAVSEEAPGRAFISNDQDPVVIYRNLAVPVPADRWPTYGARTRRPMNIRPMVLNRATPDDTALHGIVRYVDQYHGVAHIEFGGTARIAPGTRIVVQHQALFGRLSSSGSLEVVASEPGAATVRALGDFRISRVSSGDQVVVVQGNT